MLGCYVCVLVGEAVELRDGLSAGLYAGAPGKGFGVVVGSDVFPLAGTD